MLDQTKIEDRKAEIEKKFNDLKATRVKLTAQLQTATKAIQQIANEMKEIGGSYKEVCAILGLDADKEADKNEVKFKAEQAEKKAS